MNIHSRHVVTIGISLAIFVSLGCTREMKKDNSQITLKIPNQVNEKSVSTQTVDLSNTCFAVNIYNSNTAINGCGLKVGTFSSSMVRGGEDIVITAVPMGSGKTVELLRYELSSSTETCPTFNPNNCLDSNLCNMYKSGELTNVSIQESQVTLTISLTTSSTTGISSGGICSSGSIKALLTSSGAVTDNSGVGLITANARVSSISMNGSSIETWDDSGASNLGLSVPTHVRSITRKPDSNQLYGLIGQNEIIHLDGSGGYTTITTCPFATCNIPRWIQSISAGYGQNLFGVDAGGGVYKILDTGLTKIADVNPLVNQVIVH